MTVRMNVTRIPNAAGEICGFDPETEAELVRLGDATRVVRNEAGDFVPVVELPSDDSEAPPLSISLDEIRKAMELLGAPAARNMPEDDVLAMAAGTARRFAAFADIEPGQGRWTEHASALKAAGAPETTSAKATRAALDAVQLLQATLPPEPVSG